MKSEFRKRFESFLWRAGMMMCALLLDFLSQNLGLILPKEYIVMIGLMLGELSKAIRNKIVDNA